MSNSKRDAISYQQIEKRLKNNPDQFAIIRVDKGQIIINFFKNLDGVKPLLERSIVKDGEQ